MIGAELSMGILPLLIVGGIVYGLYISRGHFVNGAMRIQEWWYGQHGIKSNYEKRAIQDARDRHPSSPNNVYTFPQRDAQLYDQDEDAS